MTHPRAPIARMLEDRRAAWAAVAAAAAQLALVACGLPGLPCVFARTFGLPCPGCGMTRASLALFRGDVGAMARLHALAPFVLGGLLLAGVAAVLPAALRQRFLDRLARVERFTRIGGWFGAALVLYWLARMAFGADELARRVSG